MSELEDRAEIAFHQRPKPGGLWTGDLWTLYAGMWSHALESIRFSQGRMVMLVRERQRSGNMEMSGKIGEQLFIRVRLEGDRVGSAEEIMDATLRSVRRRGIRVRLAFDILASTVGVQ